MVYLCRPLQNRGTQKCGAKLEKVEWRSAQQNRKLFLKIKTKSSLKY